MTIGQLRKDVEQLDLEIKRACASYVEEQVVLYFSHIAENGAAVRFSSAEATIGTYEGKTVLWNVIIHDADGHRLGVDKDGAIFLMDQNFYEQGTYYHGLRELIGSLKRDIEFVMNQRK